MVRCSRSGSAGHRQARPSSVPCCVHRFRDIQIVRHWQDRPAPRPYPGGGGKRMDFGLEGAASGHDFSSGGAWPQDFWECEEAPGGSAGAQTPRPPGDKGGSAEETDSGFHAIPCGQARKGAPASQPRCRWMLRSHRTGFGEIEILERSGHMGSMTMFSFHMRFLRAAGILLNRR